jgi:ABC-type uncharacterized transport system substrate-binding protein
MWLFLQKQTSYIHGNLNSKDKIMKTTIKISLTTILALICLTAGCSKKTAPSASDAKQTEVKQTPSTMAGKKVLFINSYHKGYDWSDRQQKGAEDVFSKTGVELKTIYMDTKNNPSEEFSLNAAVKIKGIIEEFKPDVVITGDDNAFKYIIAPYYRDAALPVVFCGLNWDASVYGAPYKNTTGMLEIALIDKLVGTLKTYAKGSRVGFITADVLSEHKNAEYFTKYCGVTLTETIYAKDFAEWKKGFIELQNKVDMLIIGVSAGVKDWNDAEAENFVLEETKIPTGVEAEWMMHFALAGYVKVPEEQGEWAANAAIEIMNGKSPADIPVAGNKKARVFLNMKLAKKLGIVFPIELVNQAEFVE